MTPTLLDLIADDGHRFSARRFGASGPAARSTLLFLPALGVPAHKYDRFGAALAAAGVDVTVPEWRGIASSSRRAGRSADWDYRALLTRDLDAAARATETPCVFGGHSLGAQFATLLAARRPERCTGLVLVAAGVPHPSTFPPRHGRPLAAVAAAMPAITRVVGHFPGKTLRFAGREAGGVMRDWASTVRSGRYGDYDGAGAFESRLAAVDVPTLGVVFRDDWMAPRASLDALIAKLGSTRKNVATLAPEELGTAADHFAWLRAPAGLVRTLVAQAPLSS